MLVGKAASGRAVGELTISGRTMMSGRLSGERTKQQEYEVAGGKAKG